MERIAKQVLNVRGRKGCAAALSREYQRNWSDRAWQVAIAKGNYDLGRQHLNFQIILLQISSYAVRRNSAARSRPDIR